MLTAQDVCERELSSLSDLVSVCESDKQNAAANATAIANKLHKCINHKADVELKLKAMQRKQVSSSKDGALDREALKVTQDQFQRTVDKLRTAEEQISRMKAILDGQARDGDVAGRS